jgi:hypothetical protein
MRFLSIVVAALLSSGCGITQWLTSPSEPTDNPFEIHILAETQRYAGVLHVKITAEVTDEIYYTTCSDGTQCPAAGWYIGGHIRYWRPVVRDRGFEYGTALARHESCHSKSFTHGDVFIACENMLKVYDAAS